MNVLYWVGRTVGLVLALAAATAHAGSYEDLFFALRGDDAATVRALQEREFDPNTRNLHGQVGLYVALQNESFAAAQVLMAHPKLQVDAVNTAGESPLMIAALKGQLSWCQRLFDRGASVNLPGAGRRCTMPPPGLNRTWCSSCSTTAPTSMPSLRIAARP